MGAFESSTAKRHVIWSNDERFISRIVEAGGYLSLEQKKALAGQALCTNKVDPRTGRKTFTGIKKRVKASQTFACPGQDFANLPMMSLLLLILLGWAGFGKLRRYTAKFARKIAEYFRDAKVDNAACLAVFSGWLTPELVSFYLSTKVCLREFNTLHFVFSGAMMGSLVICTAITAL